MVAHIGAVLRPAALYLPRRPAARLSTAFSRQTIALIASRHRNLPFPLTLAASALAGVLATSAIMDHQESNPDTTGLNPVRNETVVYQQVRAPQTDAERDYSEIDHGSGR
jgi:hypothetical protein